MTNTPRRRQFLQLTGIGGAASLAGCANTLDFGGDDDSNGGEHDGLFAARVGVDQESIEDLREQLEAEEIDQFEAQEEVETLESAFSRRSPRPQGARASDWSEARSE